MANKKAAAIDDTMEQYVEVRLQKDNHRYKDDVFVAVNGETCLIQRGTPVRVKRKFALALENSLSQDERTATLISELTDK